MTARNRALSTAELRWTCPVRLVRGKPARFDPTFGQEKAADALWTALGARSPQHVYVSAVDDPDRLPLVLALLGRTAPPPAPATERSEAIELEGEATRTTGRVVTANDLSREGLFGWLMPTDGSAGRAARARRGALLRGDGRVVVVEVDALARTGTLWDDFRQALRDQRVLLRGVPGRPGDGADPRSVAVPTRFRAVLVGEESTYARLFDEDRGFAEVVPVKATLERKARASARAVRSCVAFAQEVVAGERLRPLATSGLTTFLEESAREAGRKGWLSLRSCRLTRWLREADQLASERRSESIEGRDVLDARRREADRLGVQERRVFEGVLEGRVLIDTEGRASGQVNGLAVHDYGNLGKVARITATVGPGREGIVNVEREVALSGASYDKGVHILAGYLTEALACTRAAALSVRIVFEQSYGHLTGDSATCAEACAVLSALAEVPVRQDLAITGSMNQHGHVQPIGGVNEKIEGFYDICAARGLTGTQGVVIPASNVDDLMLRPDVVRACAGGRFAVYPITRVEEGLEILTGKPAGRTEEPGKFRRGSVFALAAERLEAISELAS